MGSCFSCENRRPLPTSSTRSNSTPKSSISSTRKNSTSSKRESTMRAVSKISWFNWVDRFYNHPNRKFLNGSTEIASLHLQKGNKGINQDAMLVWKNFGSRKDTVFCGVFDGHGPYGHLVSRQVRDCLPLNLYAQLDMEEGTQFQFEALKDSFLLAFKVMDKELRMNPNFDCICSGTTALTLVKQGRDLVIGNVGDSRAVLGTRDADDELVSVQLTVDLKPDLPAEEARIRKCRGRVFALEDEPEVARVWLPGDDGPGLAMARSLGDFCLKEYGLISEPEITYRRITEKDEFIVLASDGIWDVLTNEEVVSIVSSCCTRARAARAVVDAAVKAWKLEYPTSMVDDCAVICLFLNSNETDPLSEEDDYHPSICTSSSG